MESDLLQQQAEYWKTSLMGAPTLLELPTDHARPVKQPFVGVFAGLVLDEELTAHLRQLSTRHGTKLFMTLLAAWATLLARLSGQQDLVVGTLIANRGHAENLIGLFPNPLILRLDLSGSPTVGELLARVKKQVLAVKRNQDIPLEQVPGVLQPINSRAHHPLLQALFTWQGAFETTVDVPGLQLKPFEPVPDVVTNLDLTLSLREAVNTIVGGLEYAAALFEPATIERYLGYLRTLLEGMVDDDTRKVDYLALLSESERQLILYTWNHTHAELAPKCLHELFEEQVPKCAERIAVVFEDSCLSYDELNRRANQLAHYLGKLGVKPETRVAICMERSLEMVVALLGVLKAGGAYVPLDPAYPLERLRYMLKDSAPLALLTQERLQKIFSELSLDIPVVKLDPEVPRWQEYPDGNPDGTSVEVTSRQLAYIIYTSGSTGTPKGVMNEHRGVVNRLVWMQRAYGLSLDDAVLQKTPFSFDVSLWEFFWPLLNGARLVMARPEGHRDPEYLIEAIRRNKITTMHFVPSMLHVFLDHADGRRCSSLVRVVSSGEALPATLVQRFQDRLSGTALHNLYGPTEAAVDVTAWTCVHELSATRIPIGRPIMNMQIYILDRYGQPVPIGVVGEIHIGGVQVARGYLNRPELTAEHFIVDPFAAEQGARMYKTGDLGRFLPDGTIEFLGRNDSQVKIRGVRIELGEIEARLREHPNVRDVAVIVR